MLMYFPCVAVYTMDRRPYRIRTDHHEFLQDSPMSISGLVRNALDNAMNGDRELPEETQRDTFNYDFKRTTISVTPEHDDYIGREDFSFTIFVHEVLQERIDIERRLQELDE